MQSKYSQEWLKDAQYSRNTVDLLETVRKLKKKGIYIYFEVENIDTKDDNIEFILSIYGGLALEEAFNISSNVSWGYKLKFEERDAIMK